ncbi:hypothetical protein H5410_062230 [Solanum commersonii]|uniref:Uncharacterized protein n=1 Tax=Solanum commersonii TaxID=4109 RepID=A0A9J5WBN1_SOLCO|nr:hypothetical protein H5410_062230 [Solanum commersonii]
MVWQFGAILLPEYWRPRALPDNTELAQLLIDKGAEHSLSIQQVDVAEYRYFKVIFMLLNKHTYPYHLKLYFVNLHPPPHLPHCMNTLMELD